MIVPRAEGLSGEGCVRIPAFGEYVRSPLGVRMAKELDATGAGPPQSDGAAP